MKLAKSPEQSVSIEKPAASSLAYLRDQAKSELAALRVSERALLSARDDVLNRAWRIGQLLSELKIQVGRGNWYLWLESNLPELGIRRRSRQANAARCIALFRRNSDRRNSCGKLSQESVRKFMWGYVPKKDRIQLPGDGRDRPALHHLTFINAFWKWDNQVKTGASTKPDRDILRHEVEPALRRLAQLCGEEWVLRVISGTVAG